MWIPLLALANLLCAAPAPAPLAKAPTAAKEDLWALIDAAGTAADHPGAGAVLVVDHTSVRVEDSGLAHYSQRRVYKVLTQAGATQLATMRFDYDPASNFIKVSKALVHSRDDQKKPQVQKLDSKTIRDLPQPQHWIYWGPRMKLLPIPRLRVGEALEVETYKKGFIIAYLGDNNSSSEEKFIPPMRGHYYDVVLFGKEPLPVVKQHYSVTLPKNKALQFQVYNGEVASSVTFDETSTSYTFWKHNLAPHTREARAADKGDYLTKVVMATVPDWQTKSRWFAEVNEGQFVANDAIRKKVAEITKNARSDEEKIDAILHWTAQEIRYSGISMGKGEGYTLHSGAMTFNDRAGVCKDIAGMSITMLRAAGLTSYPAMTMATGKVEQIPADQFNHCVVAVKQPEGYRMIDPTWAPFSAELWSSAEREQHYVIGTPKGETLMMTPYLPPQHNRLKIVASSQIDFAGNLVSEVTISGNGYPEDRLRRQIAGRSTAELRPSFAKMLTRVAPTVVLEDLRFTDHRNLKKPFVVKLRYRVPRYAHVGDRVLSTKIPSSNHLLGSASFADWLSATTLEKRTSAIWLRSPQLVEFEERLKLPTGFRLPAAVPKEHQQNGMGALESTLEQQGDQLLFRETITIKQRNIAAADYPQLKQIVDAVRRVGKRSLYLKRTGGKK